MTVARRPTSEPNVAANVLLHKTGGVDVDRSRIAATDPFGGGRAGTSGFAVGYGHDGWVAGSHLGRWPANVVLSPEAVQEMDSQSGVQTSGIAVQRHGGGQKFGNTVYMGTSRTAEELVRSDAGFGDVGGASRFFKRVGS